MAKNDKGPEAPGGEGERFRAYVLDHASGGHKVAIQRL